MILDHISNIGSYTKFHSEIESISKFLADHDVKELEPGRYDIEGDRVFALVQSYTTRHENENKWEAHRNYMDIQYIVKGEEIMGWVPVNRLTVSEDYCNKNDIEFYRDATQWNALKLAEGFFAIFLPEDGHKPCCCVNIPAPVKKAVFKIRL